MILAWLILIPFLGGLLAWQGERLGANAPRWIALAAMALTFALSCALWLYGDYGLSEAITSSPRWQLEFRTSWIPRFGIGFHLGLDGLSLAMVMLTGFIGMFAVACSWKEITRNVGVFHLSLLWVLTGVIGIFLALDLFLFFCFWEVMLVPMYFLIALWGHRGADNVSPVRAATKFFIYTQASGLLLLMAIIALVFAHHSGTGEFTFDYDALRQTRLPPHLEWPIMLGFFVAFAVKLPVVPLHAWLPGAHAQAPTGGSVDLAGLLLKTAAYGLLRFCLPLFPNASQEFAPIAMALGLVGIVYGALLAFAQHDIKRLIAYSSISHMGFVLIGIYAGSFQALQGVVVQMIAHGLSAAALFILAGIMYERLHTRDLREMGGLWSRVPLLPAMTLFFAAASLGIPGTGNFIGEFLILLGSYPVAPLVTALATGGLVLGSVYALVLVQRAFYGPAKSRALLAGPTLREYAMLLSLIIATLWIGLYPQPVLNTSAAAVTQVQHAYATALDALEAHAQ